MVHSRSRINIKNLHRAREMSIETSNISPVKYDYAKHTFERPWVKPLVDHYNNIATYSTTTIWFAMAIEETSAAQRTLTQFEKEVKRKGWTEESYGDVPDIVPEPGLEQIKNHFQAARVLKYALKQIHAWLQGIKDGRIVPEPRAYERMGQAKKDQLDEVLRVNSENGWGS